MKGNPFTLHKGVNELRLYDLTEQYNTLAEMLEDDADNDSLRAMLDGIDGAFDEKVESIVKLMKSKQGMHTAIQSEAKRLNERAAKIAKEIDWLEQYVEDQMKRLNKDEIKSSLFTIKLALNPPSVGVDIAILPEKYFRVIPSSMEPDKKTIAAVLKAGEQIPGAWLKQEKTLRIK